MNRMSSAWRRVAHKPPRQIAQVLARRLASAVRVEELDFPLADTDVWDSARPLRAAAATPSAPGAPTRVAWMMVPPGIGAGGPTTFFRMMESARAAGYENTLVFYDHYHGDFATNVARVRRGWPWLDCEIIPAPPTLDGFEIAVASSWQTAHALAARSHDLPMHRAYFVQDFEPYFYPRGALSALALDSYRFGFTNLALGDWVARTLRDEADAPSEVLPFGSDREVYRLADPDIPRDGVVFFAKVANDRRGYRLTILALKELQRRHPSIPIHAYGDFVQEPGLRLINHGYLAPARLNELYNSVAAGIVLSFTNVSLIPAEMAAAGATPVMNAFEGAREVFTNPCAVWAAATPVALAEALADAATAPDLVGRAHRVAEWSGPTWQNVGEALVTQLHHMVPARGNADVL